MERLAEFRASQFKFANFLDDPARRPDGKGFDYFLQLPIQVCVCVCGSCLLIRPSAFISTPC